MKRVAKFLAEASLANRPQDEFEVFGRSVFNRYYYATFWIARSTLAQLDDKWSTVNHANIPDILRKTFADNVKKRLKTNADLVSNPSSLKHEAISSGSAFADLLKHAYGIRVLADYDISASVARKGSVICINTYTSSDASTWPKRAEIYSGAILRVSKELGLI